jgi:MGT family glycosyltransferase
MGTLQNRVANVFHTIAAATSKFKDVQLVLSLGDHVNPKEIGPLPTRAIRVRHAPQLELLKHASVCITHAGLNTVLEALARGVPQVAIPVTNDQPGVAARIADKKTGLFTPLKELTAPRLSRLVDEVLTDPTFRNNSGYFRKIIAETNGLSMAANILEEAFGLTHEPLREPAREDRQSAP